MTKLFFAAIAAAFLSFAPMAFADDPTPADVIIQQTQLANKDGTKLIVIDQDKPAILDVIRQHIAEEANVDVADVKPFDRVQVFVRADTTDKALIIFWKDGQFVAPPFTISMTEVAWLTNTIDGI